MEKATTTTFFSLLALVLMFVQCFLALGGATPNYTTDQSALLAFKSHITYDPNNILASNWSTNTSICNWIGVSYRHRGQHRVTSLDLSNMGLRGTVPPQIGNLSFLAYFNISKNDFNGHLPAKLAQLHRLKVFHLAMMPLSMSVFFSFFLPLKFLLLDFSTNEMVVDLFVNDFSGEIPLAIFNVSSIRQINFGNNSFSGSLPNELCHWLPKLTMFFVSSN